MRLNKINYKDKVEIIKTVNRETDQKICMKKF